MSDTAKKSSPGVVLFAWILVGLPLGWGVYNTLLNSMKLFQPAPAATAPANAAPAPAPATAPTPAPAQAPTR
jgi:hypothetical protein